jgi:hypothetical protein
MTPQGAVPTPPASLNAQLIALAQSLSPGLTVNLPGSMIEDISSTDTGALIILDQMRVDYVNSITPYGANAFMLTHLGQIYGVDQGVGSNTSVYVQFIGPPGYVVAQGFTVGDGTYQYVIQDGGIINSSGSSSLLFSVATTTGSWSVLPGTVTQLVTSVPQEVLDAGFAVNNPQAGLPGTSAETEYDYRARVLQAGLAASQGMPRYLKTLLGQVPGVQQRLIAVLSQVGGGWLIMVGGGDPFAVANAVWTALFDTSSIVASTIAISNISKATLGVVTTAISHGLTTGQANVYLASVAGMTAANGGPYTVTAIDDTHFTFGVNTSTFGAYTSGGVVTPNSRNVSVSINDYPDTYTIPIVVPLQQTVSMVVTWNTTSDNFVSEAAVAQLGAPALAAYVNSIAAGQPMNLFELQATFQQAISNVLDPNLLTRMVFAVAIDGVGVSPSAGTGILAGDPQSYLSAIVSDIDIVQG